MSIEILDCYCIVLDDFFVYLLRLYNTVLFLGYCLPKLPYLLVVISFDATHFGINVDA